MVFSFEININRQLLYRNLFLESIRLFPPGFFSNKLCTEPIELTDKNGKTLYVPKNTVAVLPLHAIMVDEDYYSDPNTFEPERFLEENGGLKKYKDLGVYYGFGEGPRACLGKRLSNKFIYLFPE